MGEKQ